MTTQHYPGPWRAASGPSSIVGWPVVAQSGRLICNVSFIQNTDDITGPDYAAYKEQCGANARLIAAAPLMYEALDSFPMQERETDEAYARRVKDWWLSKGGKSLRGLA